jgi:alkylation response protein AidB-like acyl-CoA dehydrogenase
MKMDFKLNEEQEMFKEMARKFFEAECDVSMVRKIEASDSGHMPEVWAKMAELGWLGIIIPEEYEGFDLSLMEVAILFEEIGRAAFDSPLMSTLMGTLAILEGGSEAQKKKLLPEIVAGNLIITLANQEPNVSYDPRFVSVSAASKDDGFILNGTKLFVPYANVADSILVVARTQGNPGDEEGITVFMVDAKDPGIELTPLETVAPDRQFQVEFKNVEVSSENILGGLDSGLPLVEAVIEKATAIQCAEMVGGAEQEIKATAQYSKERIQFDRPIGSFQAVQHHVANMYTDINGSRLLTYQSLFCLSQGQPASREVAMAKAFTSNACQRVSYNATQVHGGMGVDMDNDLHFYFRRSKAMDLRFGPSAIHLKALETELGF